MQLIKLMALEKLEVKYLQEIMLPRLTGCESQFSAPANLPAQLLVPIHRRDTSHFILAVLNIDQKQWTHLDSFHSGNQSSDLRAQSELDKLKAWFAHHAKGRGISWSSDILTRNTPAQQTLGSVDCGVFVIAWAYALANGLDVVHQHPFCASQMSTIRLRLAQRILDSAC